uniref:Protein kinase domain-containing protein n=1 Tax=Panagrolaimus sp. ES5 TaxID=591445 RepID=A0AC34G8M3_9BILA
MKYTNEDRFNLEKEYETSQKCWNKEKLLKCLQFVRCETYSYLIMELTGQTLEAALSSDDITLKEICRLYIEALQGLEQLHGLNMIHQDFKPNNLAISLRRPGKVVVIDFGAVAEIVKGRCINGCMGTKTFAARDAMDKKKQGQQYFRSDLESWYYCLVSACKDGKLGWEYLRSYDAILAEKKNAWKKVNRRRFLSGLPVQFLDIMKLIDQMRQTRGQTYQPYYDLLNLIVEAESPVLVPAVEPFSFAATESEEDDPYLYYETHGEKKGIRKAGNNYTKQSKLVNHESGKLAVMKCRTKTKTGKECNFRAYVDANMFQRAKHGDVARIVKTSDNGHQH